MKKLLFISLFFQTGFFFSIASLAGCDKETMNDFSVMPAPSQSTNDTGYKYLALGDSYTIGQGVQEAERFPHITASLLRQQGLKISDPLYIAQTGWSTAALQAAIQSAGPLGIYDIVSLLIGVNDQYQHLDTAGYRTRFAQLLAKSVSLTGGKKNRVFVLSIPDYSATPFVSLGQKASVSRDIDAFNLINKEITLKEGITHIDITPLTRDAASDPSLLTNDNLHYSAKEHKLWADKLVPAIKEVLK